jgi:hypothetical protein
LTNDRPHKSVVGLTPPPRKDDKLFGPAEDWQLNACVNYSHRAEWLYSDGYRTAARSLAEEVCESGREQDSLVYPIVYLYRHHSELVLKGITVIASALLDRQLTEAEVDALGRHGLKELWTNLRPLLNPVCELVGNAMFPAEDLDGIESYIQQIHEHDPDGQRFRYATVKLREKKKAKRLKKVSQASAPSLRPDLKLINIRVFAEAMEMLANYLECIEEWFNNLLQTKYEMEREAYESAY